MSNEKMKGIEYQMKVEWKFESQMKSWMNIPIWKVEIKERN
jgi:hypothetical protein